MIFNVPANVAHSYRLPSSIEHVLDRSARQSSVLLGGAPMPQGIGQVIEGSAGYLSAVAVLPVDPEADLRIEQLLAAQPRRGEKILLKKK